VRILFAGSPEIALPCLEALVRAEIDGAPFQVVGLLTNPDTPKGRRGSLEPTEMAQGALRLNQQRAEKKLPPIEILKPLKLGAPERESVVRLAPDVLVSFAYGKLFGPKFLALFPRGGINVHPSLLPRYRGATPIPAAILNRDRETGITIQTLALEMDGGDILAQERIPLNLRETTASLSATVAQRAPALLLSVLGAMNEGKLRPQKQSSEGLSYCGTIAKDDGLVDWSWGALDVDARIRAYNPWPLCFTFHADQRLFLLEAHPYAPSTARTGGGAPAGGPQGAAPSDGFTQGTEEEVPGTVVGVDKKEGILVRTGQGLLALTHLQYQAKKALDWRSFLNGARNFVGSHLG